MSTYTYLLVLASSGRRGADGLTAEVHVVTIDIRTAVQSDLSAINALSRTTPWEKTEFLERQISRGHVTIAVENRIILGFIVWDGEFFERPFIWLVVVNEHHRRSGVGACLFKSVEDRCAARHLYTSTNRSNHVMAAFLASRGYSAIGELDLDPGDPEVFYRVFLPGALLGGAS